MKTFNIGELSEKSGVASHAIRFYERENLMPEPARTQSNYRRYPEDAMRSPGCSSSFTPSSGVSPLMRFVNS